jgi:hypothetical protein
MVLIPGGSMQARLSSVELLRVGVVAVQYEDVAMSATSRAWLADILIGGLAGGVVGAIAAINFVIYVGIEDGYEASIPEVFRQNTLAGIVTVAILLMGPVAGVSAARRRRRSRTHSDSE